ncbi:MAG: peroxiredoxin family protein [Candidatus Rokuibacteriota bacterium]
MILTVLAVAVLLAIAPGDASADPFQDLSLIRPAKPTPAPDFTLPSLPGGTVALQAHRGSVVFLNFWATWCPPCKEEMPSMERLYRRFKDRGFTILALSLDTGDPGKVATFVKALDLTFPIGLDLKGEVANRYAIRGLPGSFLIDRSGEIIAVAIGPRDWDSRPAHAVVEALLK